MLQSVYDGNFALLSAEWSLSFFFQCVFFSTLLLKETGLLLRMMIVMMIMVVKWMVTIPY